MSDVLLEIKNLSKKYNNKEVVSREVLSYWKEIF